MPRRPPSMQEMRKMIRQEAPNRFELGHIIAVPTRGTRQFSVRLHGGRIASRVYNAFGELQIGDRVLCAHVEGLNQLAIIAHLVPPTTIRNDDKQILAPPTNLTATPFPGGVLLTWDTTSIEDVVWQVQHNDSAAAAGATDAMDTRGSYYIYHIVDQDADAGAPVTRYFRVRAFRYFSISNTQVSGWSTWQSATTVTWDGRYRTETELASTANGDGASMIGVEDAGANWVGTDVEAVLAEIAAAAPADHDHSAPGSGGQIDWDDVWSDAVHDHSAAGEGGTLDWDSIWSDAVHDHSAAGEGGTLDWDDVWSDAVHNHSSAAEGGQYILELLQLRIKGPSELTIDGAGAVQQLQVYHTIDTAGDAATDDLDTITQSGSVIEGDLLVIAPAHDDRTIVVKHGTGNIYIPGGSDISMTDSEWHILLIWDGSTWCVISAGGGGGGVGAHNLLSADHTDTTASTPTVEKKGVWWDNVAQKWEEGGYIPELSELHDHTVQEDWTAACDGATTNFITANEYEPETTKVYLNGLLLREGSGLDYTEDATYDAFTLTMTPDSGLGDDLVVSYIPA